MQQHEEVLDGYDYAADPEARARLLTYVDAVGAERVRRANICEPLSRYEQIAYHIFKMQVARKLYAPQVTELPCCTIFIPVSSKEDVESFGHTIRVIEEAAAHVDGPIEVTAWMNYRFLDDEELMFDLMEFGGSGYVFRKTDHIRQIAKQPRQNNVNVVPVHVSLYGDDTMLHLRARAMDGIIGDALVRGLGSNHPILWFDADTTFIGRHTMPRLLDALAAQKAHFVKATEVFTGEPGPLTPLRDLPDPEKVAVVYSLARRMMGRSLTPFEPRYYHEEDGFGFTLGTWLALGGFDMTDPTLGESKVLLERARKRFDDTLPLVYYPPGARKGTSYRRIRLLAQTCLPSAIPDRGEDGDDYDTYINATRSSAELNITAAEITAMIDQLVEHSKRWHGSDLLTAVQRRRLASIALKCGF